MRLEWKRNAIRASKELDRTQLLKQFKEIVARYPGNNEVSKKLVEAIPVITVMYINWDDNTDVKKVYYWTDTISGSIPIPHHHKIVWNILKELCQEKEI